MTEQTISSTPIYQGKVINVRKDRVRFESGAEADRDIVEHRGAVAIVAMPDPNSVLLVRQYRTAAAQELIEIPAGSLNEAEDPFACAHRELIEETQLRAGKMERLFSVFTAPGYSSEMIHLFLATDLTPEAGVGDEDEFIDVLTVPMEAALAMIDDGHIQDAKSVAGLLAVARRSQ